MNMYICLDCHGEMTPSSGPPIKTIFFNRKKFCLYSDKQNIKMLFKKSIALLNIHERYTDERCYSSYPSVFSEMKFNFLGINSIVLTYKMSHLKASNKYKMNPSLRID